MADWSKITSRGRVIDRRGAPGGLVGFGGLGLAGIIITLAFSYLSTGQVDINQVLEQLNKVQVGQLSTNQPDIGGNDDYATFAASVLGSTNDMWKSVFTKSGQSYEEPQLVLFREATRSGCGVATSEVGPHYCSADNTIYLDETFFDLLTKQLGAKGGDVAEAYVIAHEVGHHVQNLLGTMDTVATSRDQQAAIDLELQADCYAGLWAHSIRNANVFESNEILEAMDAAEAVGDDRIQKKTTGRVDPESWTHGSAKQRHDALQSGYESGNVGDCDYL